MKSYHTPPTSTHHYNNYSISNNNNHTLQSSSLPNSYHLFRPIESHHYDSRSKDQQHLVGNDHLCESDNVQYGPPYHGGRRRSFVISSGHNRRSQTPQPPQQSTSFVNHSNSFQLYAPPPSTIKPQAPTVDSQPNVPRTNKSSTYSKVNNDTLLNPLPLTITPIVGNFVVRVPTARRRMEKAISSPTVESSPPKRERQIYHSQECGNTHHSSTNISTKTTNCSLSNSSTHPITQNRPSSVSFNRTDRPLKPYSSSGNLLMNRPRSSTPTLKKSTSLGKLPPRDYLRNKQTKKPSIPESLKINSGNVKKKASGMDGKEGTSKKELPTPSHQVPNLLKSMGELKANQAKIEILTLEDYMLDSPLSKL